MHDATDMQLLRQYADGNSDDAFATLVSRHVNLVYSAAFRKTGNPHAAEKITQAVFIILAQKAGRISDKTILHGWLYQTARLTAASFLKREIRRARREQEASMPTELHSTAPDETWQQLAPLLEDAMGQLGETDRAAVVLRFFGGKSFAEVATASGVTENAAKKRVNRALEKLHRYFSKRGVRSTTDIIARAISAHSVQAAPAALVKSVTAVAIAKGAAASGSTLTLIKGALKLMAWSQAKTAIVAGAVVLLAAGTTTVTNQVRHTPPRQTGRLKLPTGNATPMIVYSYSRCGVILASDGSLWSWGEERSGWPVLGLANSRNTVSLRRIGNETDWVDVAADDSHCLAVKSDGTIWAWGGNFRHQLGDGTTTTRTTPVPSVPGNDWKQVAAGGSATSFAIKKDGTLWAWGHQYAGPAGNGPIKDDIEAVQVDTSTSWTKIWAGSIQTVGLQADGSLWFWGSLTGDANDTNVFLVPTRISPDTNWADACFGYFTVFAIKSDGTLWSWGLEANFYTHADASSNAIPMQVGTDNDWQACASSPGCFYHILTKKDGSLWALDASEHRRVKPAAEYKPVKLRKIDLRKDIAAVAAGGDDMGVVLTRDGEVWTWGAVLGEHSPKDFEGPKGEHLNPKCRSVDKPWQLSNIDSTE